MSFTCLCAYWIRESRLTISSLVTAPAYVKVVQRQPRQDSATEASGARVKVIEIVNDVIGVDPDVGRRRRTCPDSPIFICICSERRRVSTVKRKGPGTRHGRYGDLHSKCLFRISSKCSGSGRESFFVSAMLAFLGSLRVRSVGRGQARGQLVMWSSVKPVSVSRFSGRHASNGLRGGVSGILNWSLSGADERGKAAVS